MTVSTAAASSLAANTAGGGVGTVTNLEDSFWHKVTLKRNAGIPITYSFINEFGVKSLTPHTPLHMTHTSKIETKVTLIPKKFS